MDSIFRMTGAQSLSKRLNKQSSVCWLGTPHANVTVMYKTVFCFTLFLEICAKEHAF